MVPAQKKKKNQKTQHIYTAAGCCSWWQFFFSSVLLSTWPNIVLDYCSDTNQAVSCLVVFFVNFSRLPTGFYCLGIGGEFFFLFYFILCSTPIPSMSRHLQRKGHNSVNIQHRHHDIKDEQQRGGQEFFATDFLTQNVIFFTLHSFILFCFFFLTTTTHDDCAGYFPFEAVCSRLMKKLDSWLSSG